LGLQDFSSKFDIRIADFGYAERITKLGELEKYQKHEEDKNASIIYGTASYIPPEAFSGKGYGFKSDVYAVGSILFNLLTHKYLFPGNGETAVLRANKQGNVSHVPY
jgi:serine/threonine protein kinase